MTRIVISLPKLDLVDITGKLEPVSKDGRHRRFVLRDGDRLVYLELPRYRFNLIRAQGKRLKKEVA